MAERGLLFVAVDDGEPLASAAPGRRLKVPGRGPPWIVICHQVSSVLPKWPGRLWLAEIIDAASDADMRRHGGRPLASAGYTRAVAIEVIEELPIASLFGDHGEAVVEVLKRTETLDITQAQRLASARAAGAEYAYARAWKHWLAITHPELDIADRHLSHTLEWYGSPINRGFSVLHQQMYERAERLVGEDAFEDDEEERWLVPPWSDAAAALLEAAMALGAPACVPDDDRHLLLKAYQEVFED